jgi:predicted DNA-binding transcriptional regulator AlpA
MDTFTTQDSERLLPLSEVMRRTSKGRSAIYAAIRCKPPRFPLPVKDGISTRWVESEIDGYIRSRIAERDAKAAA